MARKNSKGQFLIETILISVIFISTVLIAIKYLKNSDLVAKIFTAPIEQLKNVATYGDWEGAHKHPNFRNNQLTMNGERKTK